MLVQPAAPNPATLFVRGARQLVTMRGPAPRRGLSCSDLGVIRDGALLIEDGRIAEVGSTRRIENLRKARSAHLIDVTGKVVLPGLIDGHMRLAPGAPRLQAFERRIAGLPPPVPAAPRSSDRASAWQRARRWVHLAASSGATTVEVRYGQGGGTLQELRALRSAAKLDGDPIEVLVGFSVRSPAQAEAPAPAYDRVDEVLRRGSSPVRLASAFALDCTGGTVDLALARRLLSAASQHGYHTKIHDDGSRAEAGVLLAVETRARSAEGLSAAGEASAELLARSSTVAVLLPNAELELGGARFAPARLLIDRGAALAIASGFCPEDRPGFGLPMAMALGCREMRLMPEEALTCCTINAAVALGLDSRIGSLEPNKQADLAVFDVADYREIPYFFGVNLCLLTMKRGRVVYHAGEMAASLTGGDGKEP
ncbi:MAG: amidohydrolase family protein [Bryobacterales bacterium]|nr:amidohydrolase family protein [Bryobacterales bacterium]